MIGIFLVDYETYREFLSSDSISSSEEESSEEEWIILLKA